MENYSSGTRNTFNICQSNSLLPANQIVFLLTILNLILYLNNKKMLGPNYDAVKCGIYRYNKDISFLKFILLLTILKKMLARCRLVIFL